MINVIVVGTSSVPIREKISEIVRRITGKTDGQNGIITPIEGDRPVDMTEQHNFSPYLIVQNNDRQMAAAIARVLNKALNMPVIVDVVYDFLPKLKDKET